jgi:polysaccharide deacetylase family sporulation protein PdaB
MVKVFYLSFSKIKRASINVLMFGLATLLLAAALLQPAEIFTTAQSKPHPIYQVQTKDKVAALTFNINWGQRVPGTVLEVLKQYGVKATFFVSGSWAGKYPELANRIVKEGHEIGSNGDRQINLSAETKATVKKELATAADYIKEAAGVTPHLLRTPYGAWNDTVLATAAGSGYNVIQWSLDALDIQTPGKDEIVKNVVEKINPGDIVLMFACDTASQTPGALPGIIEGLRAKGYELVTVSNLLQHGPGVME